MTNKSVISQTLFLVFLLLSTAQMGIAQIIKDKKSRDIANDHVIDLNDGTLVVRLVSKHKNVLAIEGILERDQVSKKARKRLNRKLKKMIVDQKKTNKEITDAFSKYYDFSNYRIMYDTAMTQLVKGETKGYFLNTNFEIDPNISIDKDAPIYFLRYGQGNISETNNFEGFLISDTDNQDLIKPFPYYVKVIYPPLSAFAAFFGRSKYLHPRYARMVFLLNDNFTRFHKRALYRKKSKALKEGLKEDLKELEEEGEN